MSTYLFVTVFSFFKFKNRKVRKVSDDRIHKRKKIKDFGE